MTTDIFTFSVENLPNGNYSVVVIKNGEIVIERAYDDIKEVNRLMLITFLPARNFPISGKDAENQISKDKS